MTVRRAALAVGCVVALLSGARAETDQLPGPTGEFGKSLQIGTKYPLYITLKSVEYNANRLAIGKRLWVPTDGEKLVVLHYSIQNPTKDTINYDGYPPNFKVYDHDNNEYGLDEMVYPGVEDQGSQVDMALLPAHRVELYTAVHVPAEAVIEKLIVLPSKEDEQRVIRYDLKGKIKPLDVPFIDPKDETKAKRLGEIPAQGGDWNPLGWFDVRLDTPVTAQDGVNQEPGGDNVWMAATLTVRNVSSEAQYISDTTLHPKLVLDDGGEVDLYNVYLAKAWRAISQDLKPKGELQLRLLFAVPKDGKPKTVTVQVSGIGGGDNRKSHKLLFDVAPKPEPPAADAGGAK